MNKNYEESESILRKVCDILPIGAMLGMIILGLVFAFAIKVEDTEGTYHDYNHAIIITGNTATTIELDSYSHETIGHDKYILYSKDGKTYESTPDNVVLYNE